MKNPRENQSSQEGHQEEEPELITEKEFIERTNNLIDGVLITNIKDADFDLKNPQDKEFYDGLIGTKRMLTDGYYIEPRFFAGPDGARVPKSFETPEGFLKERLSRYQEDIRANKKKHYLTEDLEEMVNEKIKELNSLLKFVEERKTKKEEAKN